MINATAARRHDRAVFLLAWRRARRILRNGGRLYQDICKTPLRHVIMHEARGPAGESVIVNAGELWL